jgi:hypothetical protein
MLAEGELFTLRRMPGLDAIHTHTSTRTKRWYLVHFVGPYTLTPDDLRVFHAIAAISRQTGKARAGLITINPRDSKAVVHHPDLQGDGAVELTRYRTSLRQIAECAGMGTNGPSLKAIFDCIRNLTNVTVWTYVGPLPGEKAKETVIKTKMRPIPIQYVRVQSSRLIYSTALDSSDTLEITLNPRETMAVLGTSDNYTAVSMNEVRNLRYDAGRLLHARLCGWIDPGCTRKIGRERIEECLFPQPIPDDATAPRERNRRAIYTRRALEDLANIGWRIRKAPRNAYLITRPDLAQQTDLIATLPVLLPDPATLPDLPA